MLLLDTHAVLWLAWGTPMAPAALAAIAQARTTGDVLVSPVSAWEIATLASTGRIVLGQEPVIWLQRFVAQPGVRLAPLTLEAAARSAFLPAPPFHGDLADRMLVATALELGLTLVTRDDRITVWAATSAALGVIGA